MFFKKATSLLKITRFKSNDQIQNCKHLVLTRPCLLNNTVNAYFKGNYLSELSHLTKLQNTFNGKCAILATGPSIKDVDNDFFELLSHDVDFIGVNGSLHKFKELRVKPKHYIITDGTFFKKKQEIVRESISTSDFFYCNDKNLEKIAQYKLTSNLEKLVLYENAGCNINASQLNNMQLSQLSKKQHSVYYNKSTNQGLSLNPHVGIFDGATVVISAIQIALILGYKEIYIFGMDLSLQNGLRFYDEQKNNEPSFLNRDFQTKILPWFKLFSQQLNHLNVKCINISPSSALPDNIIPKLDWSQLQVV